MNNIIKLRIKHLMDEAHMNVNELEKKSGLSLSSVRSILNGRSKNPTIDTIAAIANTLGCTIDELVKENAPNTQKKIAKEESKQHEWVFSLLLEVIEFVEDHLKKTSYVPTFEQGLFFVKEIYLYSLGKSDQTLDKRFGEWFINKNI